MRRRGSTGGDPRGIDINLRSGPQMEEYRAIARRIGSDRPSRVLDWGCGFGQISDLLVREGLDVTPYEYDPSVPEGLHPLPKFPHLQAHFGSDPRRLPFDDRAFDAVLSCGVLEHVEDPDASLEEIKRVLEPGGTFYVYKLPNRSSYLEAIARRAGLYHHGVGQFDRLYTRASATELLERHGFRVQEVRRMNMLPLTTGGGPSFRHAPRIWSVNRGLSRVPGLNLLATNVELVARRV